MKMGTLKKLMAVSLAAAMLLCMGGCSDKKSSDKEENKDVSIVDENGEEPSSESVLNQKSIVTVAKNRNAEKVDYKGLVDATATLTTDVVYAAEEGEEATKIYGHFLRMLCQFPDYPVTEAAMIYDGDSEKDGSGGHIQISYYKFENEEDAIDIFNRMSEKFEVQNKGGIDFAVGGIPYDAYIQLYGFYREGNCLIKITGYSGTEEPEILKLFFNEFDLQSPYDA